MRKGEANELLNSIGIDAITDRLLNGESIFDICETLTCSRAGFLKWAARDPGRAAALRLARQMAAGIWDEKAETVLKTFPGGDPVELGRARELASHYRWRSKMFDPDTYADRVKNEHTGANGGAIKIEDVRPPIADLIAGVKVTRPNG